MGRPPLPREKARANRLVTFLTDSELETLRRQAKQEGLSLSAKAHQILSSSLRTGVEIVSRDQPERSVTLTRRQR